jgi:hypothetical protein
MPRKRTAKEINNSECVFVLLLHMQREKAQHELSFESEQTSASCQTEKANCSSHSLRKNVASNALIFPFQTKRLQIIFVSKCWVSKI